MSKQARTGGKYKVARHIALQAEIESEESDEEGLLILIKEV